MFLSVGVVDSGEFKGEDAVEELRAPDEEMLDRYVALAAGLGRRRPPDGWRIGTEVVEKRRSCVVEVAREFPQATFFSGKLIFQREQLVPASAAQRDRDGHPEAAAVGGADDGADADQGPGIGVAALKTLDSSGVARR